MNFVSRTGVVVFFFQAFVSASMASHPGQDLVIRWEGASGRPISFRTCLKVELRKKGKIDFGALYPVPIPFPGRRYETAVSIEDRGYEGFYRVKDFYTLLRKIPSYLSLEIWTHSCDRGHRYVSHSFKKIPGLIGPGLGTEPQTMTEGADCRIKAYGRAYRDRFLAKHPRELVCVAKGY